jgi:hypothetical protein
MTHVSPAIIAEIDDLCGIDTDPNWPAITGALEVADRVPLLELLHSRTEDWQAGRVVDEMQRRNLEGWLRLWHYQYDLLPSHRGPRLGHWYEDLEIAEAIVAGGHAFDKLAGRFGLAAAVAAVQLAAFGVLEGRMGAAA